MQTAIKRYWDSVTDTLASRTARHAGIVMSGNLTSALLRFGVGVMLAKTLPKSDYAYLILFMTVMDLFATFCDSGLNATMVRFLAMHRENAPGPIVRSVVVLRGVVLGVAVVGAAVCAVPFFATQEVPEAYRLLYPAALLAGVMLSLNGWGMAIMQGRERFISYAFLAVAINLVRATLIGVLMWAGIHGPSALFKTFFFSPLAVVPVSAGAAWLVIRSLRNLPSPRVTCGELIRFTVPVGATMLVAIIVLRLEVLMLKAMADEEALADYGVAYQIAFLLPLLNRALFTVLLPKVSYMKGAADLRRYRRRVLQLFPVILLLTALSIMVAPFILDLLFAGKYASARPIMQLLLFCFGFNVIGNPLCLIFHSIGRPQNILVIHLCQLPMLVGLNYLLIPHFGAVGVGITAVVVRVFFVATAILWTRAVISKMAENG